MKTPAGPTAHLAGSITFADIILTLDDSRACPGTCGTVQLEDEQIAYLGKQGNTLLELKRGVNGTLKAPHAQGHTVTFLQPTGPVVCEIVAKGGGCALQPHRQGKASSVLLMAVAVLVWTARKRVGR